MRRVGLAVALLVLLSGFAVACTAPPKPTVSFTWQNLALPTVGAQSGQDVTYAFTAANFPANSRLSLQRLQAGTWTTSTIVVAATSGTGTVRPPSGRDQYRLVLTDLSGQVLASAQQMLDVYDAFSFSTLFSLPPKVLAADDFPYDFRDFAGRDRSSCEQIYIIVHNASTTPETLRFTYTSPFSPTAMVVDHLIDPSTGSAGYVVALQPGTDWTVTALGADLYMKGTGTCYTSDGRA